MPLIACIPSLYVIHTWHLVYSAFDSLHTFIVCHTYLTLQNSSTVAYYPILAFPSATCACGCSPPCVTHSSFSKLVVGEWLSGNDRVLNTCGVPNVKVCEVYCLVWSSSCLVAATEGAAVQTVGDHHMSIFTPTQDVMENVKTRVENLMNVEQVCLGVRVYRCGG